MTNPSRTILVTGCSSGIGEHVALALHERGYRVFATARSSEAVARLKGQGLEALRLDLDDSASIRSAVHEVLARTGGELYALFNNAGYGQPGAVEDLSRPALRAQLETNVLGWLELTNAVIPAMRRQGSGRIIQNSSVLGLVGLRMRGAYVCSKFALEGLSDVLRQELHGSGIHVALVEPGPIRSRFRANAFLAYRRFIRPRESYWRETYERMERRLAHAEREAPFTLGPEAVLKAVVHALEARRPKTRYRVTVPTHLFATLKWLLPTRAMDTVMRIVSRGENR
ncbi:SDR family NAD(P)-dependent oxidoreductase [Thioalkalivibrio paradoxus]|uniref:Dehydrogenase n=1 Tax=Thioalkalivibrio paradoxus ARh 1 TaxID=713585 RepID=W0DK73_9GAMM|nr:SDR family NAD(P)-dependent oxidoreductase [Thioalkalivibrio paradoxus]AHE97393.1 dehydrogenase [Thioalkalivibrio paradoxus ARh 1]